MALVNLRRLWEREERSLWDRREFVRLSGISAFGLAFAMVDPTATHASAAPSFRTDPFTLGVASGDPLPNAVVIWTRLAPDPMDSFGGMRPTRYAVDWQVAEDEAFRKIVREGTALALPEYVHTVHVDVDGLQPGREYFYRFRTGPRISPVGRTRTAPAPSANPDRLRFAAVSCAAWFDGYYTAYKHLADEELDVVFHLGDYIYEYSVQTNGGRAGYPALPDKYNRVTVSLSDYRDRYALYKLDPDLQAAHASAPWIVTWDDHEVVNNYANLNHPSAPPADFLVRRANAYRAYWEHMPLRLPQQPVGPDTALYRRFTFGQLAEFSVLDTRQYRSDQACGDGLKTDCAERLDPSRTLLGAEQEAWLLDGLGASRARWNVIAQQIMLSQLDFTTDPGGAFSMDLWDGYKPARDRVVHGLTERQVTNPVILSGDIHRAMAAEVKANFDDPASATVATEFIGTSVSSGQDGADRDEFAEPFLANQHVKFYSALRGYVRFDLDQQELRSDYRVVPYIRQPGAPVQTRASFVTEDGHPGLQPVADNPTLGVRYSENIQPPEPLRNPPDK
ncbi:alkaline phosphatase D family protein [Actinopolymorpha sp. NPDC004070]|uniref:alkaline phosphatase D family protein n=1 Tax=Actinopolymorpha sp. NPDC004070 TaxID=3154548 RepID=UPI0033BEBA24